MVKIYGVLSGLTLFFLLAIGTLAVAQQPMLTPAPSPRPKKLNSNTPPMRQTNQPPSQRQQNYQEPPGIFNDDNPPAPNPKPKTARRGVNRRNQGPELNLALTHILPSAYVIPAGTVVLGTGAGVGLFNIMDLSTDLYLDLEQVYNLSAKISLWHGRNFAVAPWVSYVSQMTPLNAIDPTTGLSTILNMTSSSLDPGITISYRILRNLTGHLGGNLAFQSPPIPKSSLTQRTALVQGNTVHKEFTVGFSDLVAMSFGGSYDLTYDVWGAGLSFHIAGFQVGAHYYLNVVEGSVMPILGGGFATSY